MVVPALLRQCLDRGNDQLLSRSARRVTFQLRRRRQRRRLSGPSGRDFSVVPAGTDMVDVTPSSASESSRDSSSRIYQFPRQFQFLQYFRKQFQVNFRETVPDKFSRDSSSYIVRADSLGDIHQRHSSEIRSVTVSEIFQF